ncbi:MAG: hypothetical protein K2X52_10630 [Mycobacteriaceae bacterium]|nr:hypothetical protein [Mycobacteriaceae bacterium]
MTALVAVGVAVTSLVQTPGEPADKTTQRTDATNATPAETEARVCDAFDLVRRAVGVQTNTDLGPDPGAQSAVAANSRLAALGGGDYLLSRLGPTTAPELAEAVRSFANDLQDIGMNQLAGVPNTDPNLATRLTAATDTGQRIAEMCA